MEMEKEKRATAEWNPGQKEKLAIQSGGLTRGEGREHPGGGVPEDPSSHASPPGHRAFRACACVCARSPLAKEALTYPPPSRPGRQASGAKSAAPSVRRGPESVPLEPISPVRNALRPRRLPTAAARGSCLLCGPGTLGAAPRTVPNTVGAAGPSPTHPGDGRAGLPAPVRGLSGALNPHP